MADGRWQMARTEKFCTNLGTMNGRGGGGGDIAGCKILQTIFCRAVGGRNHVVY